ncbi:hypothetical protein FGO68_gene11330 [Halteria grandinella]|uniref:Uncharacterized protein n=1 Tax=Halteria grandinella TaxID=5974 RepID=A0A8J8NLN2_HALGN|nr:hypothetical protein FGO68_gene11330 [Halteria grandinella]
MAYSMAVRQHTTTMSMINKNFMWVQVFCWSIQFFSILCCSIQSIVSLTKESQIEGLLSPQFYFRNLLKYLTAKMKMIKHRRVFPT